MSRTYRYGLHHFTSATWHTPRHIDRETPSWEATKLRITTVTGERADLNGRKVVRVRINQVTTHHQFWLANIQDECILGLDLMEK